MSPETRNRPSWKDGDRILNKAEDFFTVYWELLALSKFELFTTSSLYLWQAHFIHKGQAHTIFFLFI